MDNLSATPGASLRLYHPIHVPGLSLQAPTYLQPSAFLAARTCSAQAGGRLEGQG